VQLEPLREAARWKSDSKRLATDRMTFIVYLALQATSRSLLHAATQRLHDTNCQPTTPQAEHYCAAGSVLDEPVLGLRTPFPFALLLPAAEDPGLLTGRDAMPGAAAGS
jgi:hypothetical protein